MSALEKEALVLEFEDLPHGAKRKWLVEKGIGREAMRAWRAGLFFGDVSRNMIPRDTAGMELSDGARFKALREEVEMLRAARESDQRRHEEELARQRAEVERLSSANEALGKAIGLLHVLNDRQEPTAKS